MNNQVKEILTKLKKPCHRILFKKEYEYWEETDKDIMLTSNYLFDEDLLTDEEGRQFVFQIINFEGLTLAKEIAKIQFYYHLEDDSTNIEVTNNIDNYIDPNNFQNINGVLFFDESFNLPDWETLENFHQEEYKIIESYIKEKNPDLSKYALFEVYDEFVKNILGHENHSSFVGGNLNQITQINVSDISLKTHNFIMQIQTCFSNGEIIYIFQNKEKTSNFVTFMQH